MFSLCTCRSFLSLQHNADLHSPPKLSKSLSDYQPSPAYEPSGPTDLSSGAAPFQSLQVFECYFSYNRLRLVTWVRYGNAQSCAYMYSPHSSNTLCVCVLYMYQPLFRFLDFLGDYLTCLSLQDLIRVHSRALKC